MFFVFDKKKINSYLISLGTVVILFGISFISTNSKNNTISTGASEVHTNNVQIQINDEANSINYVKNEENIIND